MKITTHILASVIALTGLVAIPLASAQVISVNAGTNGLTGWTASTSGSSASTTGTSGIIDTTGAFGTDKSWELYSNSLVGDFAKSTYAFGGNLSVGGSVTISVSLGSIISGGQVGFALQNSSGTALFSTYYIGGDATNAWKLNDSAGQENITGPTTTFQSSSWTQVTKGKQTIQFTLGAANTYSLAFNGTVVTNTGLNLTASDISQIQIFDIRAGNPVGNYQFFNSLEVVPEPATWALLAFSLTTVMVLRRRKRAENS